jgi:peptide/nickel transport system permease protein
MTQYVVRRLLQAAVVMWAAYTASFLVLYLLPGDPVEIMLSGGQPGGITTATPEQIAEVRAEYGFDKPLLGQYFTLLGDALRGDFGNSMQTRQPVVDTILDALPATLELAAAAMVIALLAGTALALVVGYTGSSRLREALLAIPSIGISVPGFWVGLLLLQLFSFRWPLFPASGNEGLSSLVLPAITLSIPVAAVFAQVLSKSVLATIDQPFVETARAKGAARTRVLFRHVLRPASLPSITLIGLMVGALLSGAVVVEVVFSRTGLGQLTANSVNTKDIPVIQGIVVFVALIYVLANIVVDLVYPLIDPRISLRRARAVRADGNDKADKDGAAATDVAVTRDGAL